MGAGYGQLQGIFYFIITDSPELSHLSDNTLLVLNFITGVLFMVGSFCGIAFPFIYKYSVSKRLKYSIVATIIPTFLIAIKLNFLPQPDSYSEGPENFSEENGYTQRVYVWYTKKDTIIKKWRSEKPFSFYNKYPAARVKWVRVK
ncbi:hypothetical protein C3K47_02520 [Solitalea longa]|uniref:Uncharacterized protein n=2 Tax=Solitalea longa TaxID=2079460 RepID=A0A2S5AAT2_9SPHI|nr:hypothetical protein C3K47_02520 [Solitalea longa]